ncbi:hypothetical protein V6N13_068623 [Hibiscus sabdariffa]|uniref:Uncharacterized protein n=1 Tax=Hibiscus sabdariffa TaxID=183260 RepID=A0ABR2QN55_9ROSI
MNGFDLVVCWGFDEYRGGLGSGGGRECSMMMVDDESKVSMEDEWAAGKDQGCHQRWQLAQQIGCIMFGSAFKRPWVLM